MLEEKKGIVKINLIGSGNIAWHLCKSLEFSKIKISEIYSRNEETAKKLADTFGLDLAPLNFIDKNADIIIIAVNDDEIESVSNSIFTKSSQIVLHTSGTKNIQVLNKHKNTGILWFLESMKKAHNINYLKTPLIYHYNNELAQKSIEKLIAEISNETHILADEQRKKMHLAAVMSNNFTNHLLHLTKNYCRAHKLDFKLLQQIMESTVSNAFKYTPENSQTGPAIRNDKETIEKHLSMLSDDVSTAEIYKLISESILLKS